jgi:hypothetical protein
MDGRWTSRLLRNILGRIRPPLTVCRPAQPFTPPFYQVPEFRARAYRAERGTARVREREELKGEET